MKTKLIKAAILGLALTAGFAAQAAGDLIEILPCAADGTTATVIPVSSVDKPIDCNTHYFKLRLVNRVGYPTQPWVLKSKVASPEDPLKMYVWISGELREAVYTGTSVQNADKKTTDFVFGFTPKAGDLALPVVLATKDSSGKIGRADVLSGLTEGTIGYYVANDHLWGFYPNGDTSQAEAVLILNDANDVHASRPEGGDWTADYSLALAGFYIKEIDFDPNSYDGTIWRSINQNDTTCVDTALPMLKVNSPTNTSSAYVYLWTKDKSIAELDAVLNQSLGTPYAINGKDEDGNTLVTTGLKMQVAANSDSKSFYIKALGTVGATTTIYMADTPTNIYYSSGVAIPNFVTRTVQVDAPNPPNVKLYFNGDENLSSLALTADSDYQTTKAQLMVKLSEPYTSDITINLGAKYADLTAVNLLTDANVSLSTTDGASSWSVPTNAVTIPAGSTMATFYIHVLGGTTKTKDGIIFSIDSIAPTAANSHYTHTSTPTLTIAPATPKIVNPVSGATFEGARTGEKFMLEDFRIDDTYANRLRGTTEGYTIYYKRTYAAGGGDAKFQTAAFTNALDGTAAGEANQFGIKLAKAGVATVAVYLQAPDGTKTGPADYVTFTVGVTQSPQVTATVASGLDAEGYAPEGAPLKVAVALSEPNASAGTLYAYLVPADTATSGNVKTCDALATNATHGVPIVADVSDGARTATLVLNDGSALGGLMTFKVFVSTADVLTGDPDYGTYPDYGYESYDGYAEGTLMMYVVNVEPTVEYVQMGASDQVKTSEGTFSTTTSQGLACEFAVKVKEPSAADLDATAGDNFIVKLTFYDGSAAPQVRYIYGNPNTLTSAGAFANTTNFTFQTPGLNRVVVALKDKDMEDFGEAFTAYVQVNATPGVEISSGRPDLGVVYPENGTGPVEGALAVNLTAAADVKLRVGLLVDYAKAGDTFALPELNLDTTAADLSYYGLGTAVDVYVVEFNAGYVTSAQNVYFTFLDGTTASAKNGVKITPYILTDGTSTYGNTYKELYSNLTPFTIYPENREPEIVFPSEASETVTNQASIGVLYTREWSVGDIEGDFKSTKAKVELTVEGKTTSVAEGTATDESAITAGGEFSFSFTSTGAKTVTLTVTDKDGAQSTRNLYFMIDPAKNVYVYPHGGNHSALSTLSSYYVEADGLGSGYVWQENVAETDSAHKYTARHIHSFDKAATTASFVAMGDTDAWLGNGATTGLPTFDSFLYGWIVDVRDDVGNFTGTFMGPSPVYGKSASYSAAFAKAKEHVREIALPGSDDFDETSNAYADRYLEAIFSMEWYEADNMGDINADGVPDYFAHVKKYGTGTGAVPLITPTGVPGDLGVLDSLNDDGDFYPSGGLAVPGVPSTWTDDTATPFGALLEIRGAHRGINYGMFKVDKNEMTDGWVSDLDLSSAEKKALIFAATNTWSTLPTAAPMLADIDTDTDGAYSDDEIEAWLAVGSASQANAKAFIDATWLGYAAEDVKTWGFTVENRTDPTLEDTDGDGVSDGYEYYFWYQATVGDDKGNRYVGKKFNLADIESPINISSAEIAAIFNPRIKSDWTKQDTDADGLYDKEEILIGTNPCSWDSDGDGLLDLYEVMWNIDPRRADNDGVNGNMNADGDFMARANIDGEYNIYRREGTEEYWAFEAGTETVLDDGTDFYIIGDAFQVARFNGGFTPTTEWVKNPVITRTVMLTYAGKTGTLEATDLAASIGASINLYHHQVYNYFGFDPRTGWYINGDNGSLSTTKRWLQDGSPIQGGSPVNTMAFTARNEFLLIKYRYIMGLRNSANDLAEIAKEATDKNKKWTLAGIIAAGCTNPNATFESSGVKGDWQDETRYASSTRHGADTDGDGVPDGWELYIGVNPNADFRIPKTQDGHDTLYWDGLPSYRVNGTGMVMRDFIGDNDAKFEDKLTLVQEYAGTDTTLAYQDCATIYANHPGNEGSVHYQWYNKYFPTDPRNSDTDGDGINDNEEGTSWTGRFVYNRWGQRVVSSDAEYRDVTHNFIYGMPVDEGSTNRCVRGGGLNPCTVDTDNDGLPDPWERQYAGVLFQGNQIDTKAFGGNTPDPEDFDDITAGIKMVANTTNTAAGGWHILLGMDGTFADATTDADKYPVDEFDWDGDGLQNWQEYMIQCMRHLRYDDFHTPLMGFDAPRFNPEAGESGEYTNELAWCGRGEDGTGRFLQLSYSSRLAEAELDAVEKLGYTNFVKFVRDYEADDESHDYMRDLGYFALPPRMWDTARIDEEKKYLMPPRNIRESCFIRQQQAIDIDLMTFAIAPVWEYVGTAYDPTDPLTYLVSTNVSEVSHGGTTYYWADATGEQLTPHLELTTNTYWSALKGRYVGTDPRLWDTDRDGMDDYWELFHGLNPLLGAPGVLEEMSITTNGVTEVVTRPYGADDIIYEAFGTISTYKNGWVGFNRAWAEGETPPYDLVKFPWMAGTGMSDPDGDGLRNYDESLMANLTSPSGYHTDPTPLWMTDTTATSVVYRVDEIKEYVTNGTLRVDGTVRLPTDMSVAEVIIKATGLPVSLSINVAETNHYSDLILCTTPSYVAQYYNVDGLTTGPFGNNKIASYEINEGYDTDGDFRSDRSEMQKVAEPTSDPLDFDDIRRRQSIHFGGAADPGVAMTLDPTTRNQNAPDAFKQFTVEAWVYPENPASGARQIAVARGAEYPGWDIENSNSVVRLNFALGFDETGRTMVRFDNSTEEGFVEIFGTTATSNKWLHLAGTFDGKTLRLYENAVLVASLDTTMAPANGVYSTMQDPHYSLEFPYGTYSALDSATTVGASPKKGAFNGALYAGGALAGLADDFFQGSIDEVRIWDGARSNVKIEEDYRKRFTTDEVKELRNTAFSQWDKGYSRNDNDGRKTRDPELMMHYNFTTLPGAAEATYVQKVPAGFATNVLALVRNPTNDAARLDSMVKVGWWSRIVESLSLANQVYDSPYIVPWIQNTVAHLPDLSGSVADSVFWSVNYAGYSKASFNGLSHFAFPNAMNPYTLASRKLESNYARNKYIKVDRIDGGSFYDMYRYDREMSFSGSTDLLPLGSAFAKRLAASWDGDGSEDAWAITTDGTTDDGDPAASGMPDWASAMTVDEYAHQLSMGLLPTGAIDANYATSLDLNGNGIPDWWERQNGLENCEAAADADNDGLTNYEEYFLSYGADPYGYYRQGLMAYPFNPNQFSSGSERTADYFMAAKPAATSGRYYVGELVTDHDMIENWWESRYYNTYSSVSAYDPFDDRDGDGWSNFAEARASMWTGGYLASLVDRYLGGNSDNHEESHPKPAIGLRVSYNGVQNVTGSPLVTRTYTANSRRVDATFLAANAVSQQDGRNANVAARQLLGTHVGDTTFRGHLHPGRIIPGSQTYFESRALNAEPKYYFHCEGCEHMLDESVYGTFVGGFSDYVGTYVQYSNHRAVHGSERVTLTRTEDSFNVFAQTSSDANGWKGTVVTLATSNSTARVVGSIDFLTGEYAIDFAKVRDAGWELDASVIRASYNYHIGDEWPQELWMSQPSYGRVKEGLNTVEVFLDLDGSGTWNVGEPFGVAKNVDIGWAQTSPIDIELTDTSVIVPRIDLATLASDRQVIGGSASMVALPESAADLSSGTGDSAQFSGKSAKLMIVRTQINDQALERQSVVLPARTYVLDDRAYLHEGDVISPSSVGLDWGTLAAAAAKEGLAISDVTSVTYALQKVTDASDGSSTVEDILYFANVFNSQRGVPSPAEGMQGAICRSATPTFRWTAVDKTMTAFKLQVFDSDTNEVYNSGVRRLPPSIGGQYSFTPDDLYADFAPTNGAPRFADGTNYLWRVALLNAKFSSIDDAFETEEWSEPAAFRMQVENDGATVSGYGKVYATVRYYGPGDDSGATNIIVEAYSTPDFSGAPLVRTRVTDLAKLADRDSLFESASTNAVLKGIEPGNVYLAAFIDRNNNGRRERYESWGYANRFDEATEFVYSPKTIAVTATAKPESAVIYIQDTDINKNGVLDVEETLADLDLYVAAQEEGSQNDPTSDVDRDGLTYEEETENYGTDPNNPDTDGDGLPDGWEAKFAETDPLAADADYVVADDVMAYAELPGVRVTFDDGTRLLVKENAARPQVGDLASAYNYRSLYLYGAAANTARNLEEATASALYGTGTNILGSALAPGLRITAVEDVTVVLVHAQVYGNFGFNPLTANPAVSGDDRVNTKAFTALDKYLVVRYLESMGLADEVAMNTNGTWAAATLRPGDADNNKDGIPDGWELYVMFGPNVVDNPTAADAKISPWAADATFVREAANTPDGLGALTILEKYDRGNTPLDPWSGDTNGDGISDADAYRYHLKTAADQLTDEDGDGLSNWAEYLASLLKGFDFDVENPCSITSNRLDYFCPVNQTINGTTYQLYIGEALDKDGIGLVADHDFVDDSWEDGFATMAVDGGRYANRYVWDALRDADNDGWSNFAEVRSGTRPDSVATLGIENMTLKEYPVPMINLTIGYNGSTKMGDIPIILKSWNNASMSGLPDAIWTTRQTESVADATGDSTNTTIVGTANSRYLGVWQNRQLKLYLSPGNITPSTVEFKFKDGAYISQTRQDGYLMDVTIGDISSAQWLTLVTDVVRQDDPTMGDLYFNYQDKPMSDVIGWRSSAYDGTNYTTTVIEAGESHKEKVGYVNYATGELTLDLTAVNQEHYAIVDSWMSGVYYFTRAQIIDPTVSYIMVEYAGAVPEQTFPAKFYLSTAEDPGSESLGHVREGLNTFIAFADLNGNGDFDEGEPFGYAKDVNVGWDQVPELYIELTDAPATASRFTIGAQDEASSYVRVMRTAINGESITPRAVYSKSIKLTNGRVFSEADFIADGEYDFDWKSLVADAKAKLDIEAADIASADYAVYVGRGNTEPVYTFTRTFTTSSVKPVITGAYGDEGYTIHSARPSLQWISTERSVAFVVQIDDAADFSSPVLTATNLIFSATENGYVFRPDAYIGQELEDGKSYYWRVATINAKSREKALDDLDWSNVAEFRTAIDSTNANTGYGKLAAEVRYFGPSSKTLGDVVVGVYPAADFACDPIARKRLTGTEAVTSLTNDLSVAFSTIATNVVFDGIAPGNYYVMAFVDTNGDGKRQPYETWGYANRVAECVPDLWSPVAIAVVETKTARPSAMLVMEDTDVNQNNIPDCLEDMTGWMDSASGSLDPDGDPDGDGLTNDEEQNNFGTDPLASDTDGDGMPDGWEAKFAETDPLAQDGDSFGLGDVMAYVLTNLQVVVTTNAQGEVDNRYVMIPYGREDDFNTSNRFYRTFDYNGVLAMGAPMSDVANIRSVEIREVVVVHGGVYDLFGFDPTTANPEASSGSGTNTTYGVNTKSLTALDKYLVVRYLETFSLANEVAMNTNGTWSTATLRPGYYDSDANGLPDGWELYMNFASDNADAKVFPSSADSVEKLTAAFAAAGELIRNPYDDNYFYQRAFDDEIFTGELALVEPYGNAFAVSNGIAGATAEELAEFWNYAPAKDVMAFWQGDLQTVVKRGATPDDPDTVYVANPSNKLLYATIDVCGQLVVANATDVDYETAPAGTYDYGVATNVVLVHSAVYDFFGFDATTALPSRGEGTNVVAGANTAPFTRLWKRITAEHYLPAVALDKTTLDGLAPDGNVTDSNVNEIPDGWELYVRYVEDSVKPTQPAIAYGDDMARAALGDNDAGAAYDPYDDEYFWKQLDDAVRAKVPTFTNDEAFNLGFVTADGLVANSEDFWSAAQTDDYCAYVETNCLIAVVTDAVTGDQTTYAIRPGSEDLYTTIDVNGQLYVGKYDANATLTAGEFQTIITNMVVMHAAVYDWYGWDVTTARPDFFVPRHEESADEASSIESALAALIGGGEGEGETAVAAATHVNSAAFSRLLKYITQKLYLAEFGAQADYNLYNETDNPDWWTDTNGNDLPDGWELYVKYAQNADPTLTDDDYKEAFDDGADPNDDDTDDDGIPDDAEREMGSDPTVDDADQYLEGDVMAYAELKDQTIFTATDGATTKAYVVLKSDDGARAVQVGDEITDNWTVDHTFATVFEYGNTNAWVYGVGAAAAPAAGAPWTVTGVTNATVALVHAQVYDYYGFNPKTANPTVSSNEWASVHSKAFTYLDKYLVRKWLEAEGVTDAAGCTLDVMTADANGDGIADGWELYVMFGPAVATATAAEAKISPWKTPDYVRDYVNTPDGGRLTILDEYDQGRFPTDPWSIDTDGDGVFDVYAYCYHLKGDLAGEDADGDGLSNYAEYLVSEVFQIVKVDPDKAMTDDSTLDYFRKFGELYLGEVFTDHDRVADLWEALYESGTIDGIDYAARGIYDPDADRDGDGWSNYAEYRAGTSPARQMSTGIDDYTLIEHPVPVVEMEIVYNGTADIKGRTLTVKAWNETDDADALKAPTATWTVTTANETATESGKQNATTGESVETKYLGQMPTGTRTYYLGGGAIKEGSFKLSIKDKNYVEGQIVELLGQRYFQPTGYGDSDTALWFYDVIDQSGKLVTRGGIFAEAHEVGTIDYDTGRVTINFDDEEFTAELFVGDPAEAGGSKNNSGTTTYHGLNPPTSYVLLSWSPAVSVPVTGRHYLSDATTGFLREGLTTFTVEAAESTTDVDQNSTTTANAGLYGVVRHVDVGWAGAKFTVELTDFSPVTPRIDLLTGTPDRSDVVPFDDSRINNASNTLEVVTAEGSLARVRVVRYAINGYPIAATWGAGLVDVVYENSFSATGRTKLSELDFLGEDMFDVDWTDSFTNKVANANGVPYGTYANTNGQVPGPAGTNPAGAGDIMAVLGSSSLNHTYEPVTNIQYVVVVGDGAATWERDGTNVVSALSTLITRRFDHVRARPVAVAVDGLQYAARPIFTWRMEGEEALVSRYGSSYTAFKLQVKNAAGTVIYDSGVRRAPATDADGNFTWTAPICAGSLLKGEDGNAYFYDTTGNYTWQVTMYNAKFRSDFWSAQNGASVFTTAVNEQQEVNDHGYSSIKAAVKYAGPSIVLGKVADVTTTKGKVIIQAFTTPDFSGEPLAQALATEDVADTALATANAQLKGLAAIGTYYVRAFIDMDGDGKLDEWEPWGYAKDAVTLVNDGTLARAPLVAVWIEDSDTDGDWVPDAYEYAATGWSIDWDRLKGNWDDLYELSGVDCPDETTRTTRLLSDGGIVMPIATNALTSAGFSKGLPGASFTAMQRADFVAALLGLDLSNKTTLEAIAEVTRGKLVPNSVRVVGIALEPDGSAVNLTVNADVASGISGTVVSQYYEFTGSDTVKVLVKVWKKDSLENTDWTVVYTTPTPVTITPQTNETVVVPFDTQLDLKSGFFKVELVEVVTP